jgi:BTB/POZ domain-containing protein 10
MRPQSEQLLYPVHFHVFKLREAKLREACDYFVIPLNETTVRTTNLCDLMHELSNIGARQQFEEHIERKLLPILVDCAKKGERECHIIILMDDDNVDWDVDNPPYMGDEQIQRVSSSELLRFLKYFENREIANEVLREKGMKKVRFGVEGYPTTKDKVRVRPTTGRTEVVYNYVQRPFICMSWEKDEAKSRHVNFICVRVKTDIDPESEAATLVGDHLARDPEESND